MCRTQRVNGIGDMRHSVLLKPIMELATLRKCEMEMEWQAIKLVSCNVAFLGSPIIVVVTCKLQVVMTVEPKPS